MSTAALRVMQANGVLVALCVFLCAVVAPCLSAQRMHRIAKRALTERSLEDPSGCVQNCFIKQNRALEDDVPSNATGNGTKSGGGRKNATATQHPAVRGCEIHKVAVDCLKTCPDSVAKTLYLDSILTESAQCNVSADLLKTQWDCVSNDTLVNQIKSCNSKCPAIPLGLTESIGLNPNAAQVVFINYESDGATIEKDLSESCSSASCLWPCMKPIVESKCGKTVAEQSNVINKAEIQSVINTFRDLKVINETPKPCLKYLEDKAK